MYRLASQKPNLLILLVLCLVQFVPKTINANVVGVDTQNFNPLTSGLDFVTVHSSETLAPGVINFGYFLNYAVNTLPSYNDEDLGSRTELADTLTSGDINMGIGLLRNWEIGASFPQVYSQRIVDIPDSFRGEFKSTGLTEVRLNTKYRLLGDETHGLAGVLSMNIPQIEDDPFAGVDAGPTVNVEVAADRQFGKVAMAVNLGYRFKSSGDPVEGVPIKPLGDAVIYSIAASHLYESIDTKLILELFGSALTGSEEELIDRSSSSLELLAGVKTDFRNDLAFHAGGGTEIFHGSASPDWRAYVGINWTVGPLFGRSEVISKVPSGAIGLVAANPDFDPFGSLPSKGLERFIARDVLFEFNSSRVNAQFLEVLKRLGKYLNRGAGFKNLVIEGHTDSLGSKVYNKSLSLKRATSVLRALVDQVGLPAAKVSVVGYGESQPIADNGNYQGRRLNRRVEFKVER